LFCSACQSFQECKLLRYPPMHACYKREKS
jgi:hypothetical protein